MKLDINEGKLILDVPEKYFLDIKLPYMVLFEQGKAKFEQKSKTLKIEVPLNLEKYKEQIEEISISKEEGATEKEGENVPAE